MRNPLTLILTAGISLAAFPAVLPAQGTLEAEGSSERYRIELLVFRHLGSEWPPRDTASLRDFSYALDLQPRPLLEFPPQDLEVSSTRANPIGDPAEQVLAPPDVFSSEQLIDPLFQDPLAEVVAYQPWAEVVLIEEMSEVMSDSWRRLRLSAPFRPLAHLAWEQSADPLYPTMRLRNADIILVEDPWLEERDAPAAEQAEYDVMAGVLPDRILQFSVDGTGRMRKSRFLHLELDLEFREAIAAVNSTEQTSGTGPDKRYAIPGPAGENSIAGEDNTLLLTPVPAPTGYRVQRLRQSRQIKTMRMEYFDSPVIGVLAWITLIEAQEESGEESGAGSQAAPAGPARAGNTP